MTDDNLELALWTQVAFAILLAAGLWFLPGTYGPLQFMEEHPKLAPWFSGTATSLGVIVALLNAQLKERSDDRRAEAAVKRAAIATAETACSIANMAHLNIAVLTRRLAMDDWGLQVNPVGSVIVPSLETSRDAIKRYPMHTLPKGALENWYRFDLFQLYLLEEVRALVAEKSRDQNNRGLLTQKKATLEAVQNLLVSMKDLADALDVDVEWDFGNSVVINIEEVVSAEIAKITTALAAHGQSATGRKA